MQLYALVSSAGEVVGYMLTANEHVYAHWLNDGVPERSLAASKIFERRCVLSGITTQSIDVSELPMLAQQQFRGAIEADRACLDGAAMVFGLMSVGA